MTYYDLLKQYVSTGSALSEYQFDRIKKDGQLLNSYFYSRNKVIEYDYFDLKKYELKFIDRNLKYLSKLDNIKRDAMIALLEMSIHKSLLIDEFINIKGNTLKPWQIEILSFYSNDNSIRFKIVDIKGNELTYLDIRTLLLEPYPYTYMEPLIDKIIKLKGNTLDKDSIKLFIVFSSDKEKTKNLLIQAGVDSENIPE